MKLTREQYLDLLNRSERETELRVVIKDLIYDDDAMAPGSAFRLALSDYLGVHFQHKDEE